MLLVKKRSIKYKNLYFGFNINKTLKFYKVILIVDISLNFTLST